MHEHLSPTNFSQSRYRHRHILWSTGVTRPDDHDIVSVVTDGRSDRPTGEPEVGYIAQADPTRLFVAFKHGDARNVMTGISDIKFKISRAHRTLSHADHACHSVGRLLNSKFVRTWIVMQMDSIAQRIWRRSRWHYPWDDRSIARYQSPRLINDCRSVISKRVKHQNIRLIARSQLTKVEKVVELRRQESSHDQGVNLVTSSGNCKTHAMVDVTDRANLMWFTVVGTHCCSRRTIGQHRRQQLFKVFAG